MQLALAAIPAFSDDGRLSLEELEQLLALALRDEVIDEDERRVLLGWIGVSVPDMTTDAHIAPARNIPGSLLRAARAYEMIRPIVRPNARPSLQL